MSGVDLLRAWCTECIEVCGTRIGGTDKLDSASSVILTWTILVMILPGLLDFDARSLVKLNVDNLFTDSELLAKLNVDGLFTDSEWPEFCNSSFPHLNFETNR